jgi:KDO2-lipid IV(A) lauroyltransferase
MRKFLVIGLFELLSYLPLWLLHRMGVLLGWAAYRLSGSYASRLRENMELEWHGRLENALQTLIRANIAESGKGISELPWVWRRPLEQVLAKVRECHGWELVEAALSRSKGLIILTPHIGCFEVIGLYVGVRMPITCMYRVPKLAWMDRVVRQGRERGQMKLARADIGGVRTLLKALKRGEVIGILPDQVPSHGEGEWVEFFGRPAYTMTLVTRLLEASGAAVVMCVAERLPGGAGYDLRFTQLELSADVPVTLQINRAVEAAVNAFPTQYLWSYNRYKVPRGVTPPDMVKES